MVTSPTRNTCQKCRSNLTEQRSLDGRVLKCLSCGSEYPVSTTNGASPTPVTVPAAPAPVTLTQVATSDWLSAARADLQTKLKQIAAVTALQVEAERIHAALVAYGATDVPALPWRAAKGMSRTCIRCGKTAPAVGRTFRKTAVGFECYKRCQPRPAVS